MEANCRVARNAEFVPPYGLGASMYLRPLLLGTGPELGLTSPQEFTFVVYVTPGVQLLSSVINDSRKLLPWRNQTCRCYNIGRI